MNMSSALGLVGGAGINAYVTSKHAIIGLTKTAALEQGARGIRVNACAPGPIAGQMTFKLADQVFAGTDKSFADSVPLRRHGTPDEVAGLVCFLLSDDSRYATGTTHSPFATRSLPQPGSERPSSPGPIGQQKSREGGPLRLLKARAARCALIAAPIGRFRP